MSWLLLLRSNWKLVGFGLLCLLLAVQSVRLGHEKNVSERLRIDNNELRAELKAISTKKAEQKQATGENIKKAETKRVEADKEAEKIERAPTAPNCATPPEIMGADL